MALWGGYLSYINRILLSSPPHVITCAPDSFLTILPEAGYYALPDLPSNTRVRWLNDHEKALALDRMKRAGKQLEEPVTMRGLKRVLGKWHFWVYTTYYT